MSETAARTASPGAMVMIACKHPHGIVLNTDKLIPVGNNGMVRKVAGQSVMLKGWSHEFNKIDPTDGLGGYALTPVPAAFWEEWLSTHADFPMLVDKTIIGPHKDARGQAKDHATVPKMFSRVGDLASDHPGDMQGVAILKKDD